MYFLSFVGVFEDVLFFMFKTFIYMRVEIPFGRMAEAVWRAWGY